MTKSSTLLPIVVVGVVRLFVVFLLSVGVSVGVRFVLCVGSFVVPPESYRLM
jgi:hypothetical protein